MSRQVQVLVLAGLAGLVLGCGGLFQTATNQIYAQRFYDMETRLQALPDGYPRNQVLYTVQRGARDAAAGRMTVAKIASIELSFETVVSDGQITDSEADVFDTAYSTALSQF